MNTKSPSLLVAVINFNGWKDTLECLSSLTKSRFRDFIPIVVDNASQDNSVEKIRSDFADIEIVLSRLNVGYSGACNLAIREALQLGASHCLVLNNDTVLDPEMLGFLVATASANHHAAAVGPTILDYYRRDIVLSLGGRVNMRTGWSEQTGMGESEKIALDAPFDAPGYLDGSALMFVLDKIAAVGMMNENLFMYFEDSDWCYRARDLGYSLVVEPRAKVWHKVGSSARRWNVSINYWFHRNRIFFEKKYASKSDWLCFWTGLPWHTFVGPRIAPTRPHSTDSRNAPIAPSARSVLCGLLDGLYGSNNHAKEYAIR